MAGRGTTTTRITFVAPTATTTSPRTVTTTMVFVAPALYENPADVANLLRVEAGARWSMDNRGVHRRVQVSSWLRRSEPQPNIEKTPGGW
ncbi:MAG: hypothetical protein SCK70_13225 [bacterium]|nr:hypothetical protein [bacterium]